jgi:hypothetical protein
MEIPTLREATCKKKIQQFRQLMARYSLLSTEEKKKVIEEMQIFHDSLSLGNNSLIGAGVGLGASILPVIGWITGPLIGGGVCALMTLKLKRYRKEVKDMIEMLGS